MKVLIVDDEALARDRLADLVSDVIERDLAIEDKLQQECVEWMRINRKHAVEGGDDWQIEIDRRREQAAIRCGYILP